MLIIYDTIKLSPEYKHSGVHSSEALAHLKTIELLRVLVDTEYLYT